MKTYTINTICDNDGFKKVFSCDGISKVWYFKFYDFNREIKQIKGFEIIEIQADSFNHALDKFNFNEYRKKSIAEYKMLFSKINALEARILQKFGKKLIGKKDRSKINAFLRK